MSEKIRNLAEKEKDRSERKILFILPGTDIEVSVAMVKPTEELKNTGTRYLVYFRINDEYPNIGFISFDHTDSTVDWSCSGKPL